MTTGANVKALSNVLGDRAVVGLVKFFFGAETTLEMAQELDQYDLLDAVENEADAKVALDKATVLLGYLKGSRAKMLKKGVEAIQEKGAENVNAKNTAQAIDRLDQAIARCQKQIDSLTGNVQAASEWVDRKQTQVQVNLVDDEITMTDIALNKLVADRVEFTMEMVNELPKKKLGSKMRQSVKGDVDGDKQKQSAMLDVATRLASQTMEGDSDDDMTDSSAYAEMLKLAGKTPAESK